MLTFVDMEDDLKADKNGTKKKEIIDRILKENKWLKDMANKGLSGDEFKIVDALIKATDKGRDVVEKAWEFFHKQKPQPQQHLS